MGSVSMECFHERRSESRSCALPIVPTQAAGSLVSSTVVSFRSDNNSKRWQANSNDNKLDTK